MSFAVRIPDNPLTEQQITQVHRQRGYVPRYFAAKANHINQEVFEITRRDYDKLYSNQYVVLGHLNWVIKGRLGDQILNLYTGNPTYEGGKEPINIPGVLTQNEGAVRFLSRKIPVVKNHLINYEQFYIGT
jgi:hypothetical protein